MILKLIIERILCLFGYHEYEFYENLYEREEWLECKDCKKQISIRG